MKTFVELLLEAVRKQNEVAAKEAAAATSIDKKKDQSVATPSTSIAKLQKQCQEQIAGGYWGRIFNNFPNGFCLSQGKFKDYLNIYHRIGVAISTANQNAETGLMELDESHYSLESQPVIIKMKEDLETLLDNLINDICELLLNTEGEIRKDILDILDLNSHQQLINKNKKMSVLGSCLEGAIGYITNTWMETLIRRKDSGKVCKVKDDSVLAAAHLTALRVIEKHNKKVGNMEKIVGIYTTEMRDSVSAKRARDYVLKSQQADAKYTVPNVEKAIEAEINSSNNTIVKNSKITTWINIVYYCIAYGDYVAPRAFLNICKKDGNKLRSHILQKIGDEYAAKYISCYNCLTYHDENQVKKSHMLTVMFAPANNNVVVSALSKPVSELAKKISHSN